RARPRLGRLRQRSGSRGSAAGPRRRDAVRRGRTCGLGHAADRAWVARFTRLRRSRRGRSTRRRRARRRSARGDRDLRCPRAPLAVGSCTPHGRTAVAARRLPRASVCVPSRVCACRHGARHRRWPSRRVLPGWRDRTGLVAALVLALADVEPEAIAADHRLSEQSWEPFHEAWFAEAESDEELDRRQHLVAPARRAMLEVLDGVDAACGGVRDYLLAGGASPADLDRLVLRLRPRWRARRSGRRLPARA